MEQELKKEKGGADLADLKGIVSSLKEEIDEMKHKTKSTSVLRKRTTVHTAFLREYAKEGETLGIVMKIYDVKEIKDPTEAKKFMGLCKLDIRNPQNGREFTEEKVNYLEFLQGSNRVQGLILKDERAKRIETDTRKGGGGVGVLYRQDKENQTVVESDHEFEVEFEDHHYFVELKEGAYKDYIIETNGSALNI